VIVSELAFVSEISRDDWLLIAGAVGGILASLASLYRTEEPSETDLIATGFSVSALLALLGTVLSHYVFRAGTSLFFLGLMFIFGLLAARYVLAASVEDDEEAEDEAEDGDGGDWIDEDDWT
jgi:hypothetical protein